MGIEAVVTAIVVLAATAGGALVPGVVPAPLERAARASSSSATP